MEVDSTDSGSAGTGVDFALVLEEEEDRGDGVDETLASVSVASSVAALFFVGTSDLEVSSSVSSIEVCDFFFFGDGVDVSEGFGDDFARGVDFSDAAGFGVDFRFWEVPDFFFVSAPAAIKTTLRKRTRKVRIMKLWNNQNLSWSDSVLAT